MSLVKLTIASLVTFFTFACSMARPPEVFFQTMRSLSLSNEDKADILEIARSVSDKRVEMVTAGYMIPSRSILVVVSYQSDFINDYIIETKLSIYEKGPSHTITRGRWGTKADLFRLEVLRVFNVEDTKINLHLPDGMSYQEMVQLLQAVKNKEIIWEDKRPFIEDFALEDISRVTLEGPEPLFVISIMKQNSPPAYFVYARLEGTKLVVKRTDMAMP